jgi:predicted adenine nucleotide alpha hydrolase (AANH) superfamily ATPase
MELLLHTCCAPCLIYPLKRLKEKGFKVKGFFYNPNIHPFSEYKNRKQAMEDLKKTVDIEIVYPEYKPEEFFQAINLKEKTLERCAICWSLRLKKTAEEAKEKGFDAFTTTLLVSPYQDHKKLREIGSDIAEEVGREFYYEDFRQGFRSAHAQAKKKGIYCQKYCGCIYSMSR